VINYFKIMNVTLSDDVTNLTSYSELTPSERLIVITAILIGILYLAITFWTLNNIKIYLIQQKRYKTFSVLTFYVLAIVIELSRILMYSNVIVLFFWEQKIKPAFSGLYVYDVCYVVAMFAKIMMGYF